jgi:hypothetical protein
MQWLAHPGTHGARTNAARALADERAMAAEVERFLVNFDHPAGRVQTPVEPAAVHRSHVP